MKIERKSYPLTKKKIMSYFIHGVEIQDAYQWLEDSDNEEVKSWIKEQNSYSYKILSQLEGQKEIKRRFKELYQYEQVLTVHERDGRIFYTKKHIDKQQPVLYYHTEDEGDVSLVDVNELDPSGLTSLDFFFPSHDGTLIAYGLSKGGSEWSIIHILNVNTKVHFPERIERARWSFIQWKKDNSGFYYTRFPKPGEVPDGQEVFNSHIRYHQLGNEPDKDPVVFALPERPQEYPLPILSKDETFMIVGVNRFIANDLYLVDLKSKEFDRSDIIENSEDFYYTWITKDRIYIQSNFQYTKFALYRTTRDSINERNWECIIKSEEDVLEEFHITKTNIICLWLSNVSSKVTVHDLSGNKIRDIPIPKRGTILSNTLGGGLSAFDESDNIYISFQTFIQPPILYKYEISHDLLTIIHNPEKNVNADNITVEDVWYSSKDSTQVHMFIVKPKNLNLNSHNPTLLWGYGGFGINQTASFSPNVIYWVENGGVFAMANIRGGGEHGEEWHKAGILKDKQRVFDDFIHAAKYLIEEKYCSSRTLGIYGGSNGGLLVGAASIQEPDLFEAVYCAVPLLDMIRYHKFSIGKTWTPEYGNPEESDDFKWLYAYSPYHNVKNDRKYPAIFFKTALNDTRVEPCHALKMTALMQNNTDTDKPILLSVDSGAGHGIGRSLEKLVNDSTLMMTFFNWRLKEN